MKIEGTLPPDTIKWIVLILVIALGGSQHEQILAMGGV
jgi:hypothetical protein